MVLTQKQLNCCLVEACSGTSLSRVKELLEAGAAVTANQANRAEVSPLAAACVVGNTDIVKCLIEDASTIRKSAGHARLRRPLDLAGRGVNLHLCAAAQRGHLGVVSYLVESCQVSIENAETSAILHAAYGDSRDTLQFLLARSHPSGDSVLHNMILAETFYMPYGEFNAYLSANALMLLAETAYGLEIHRDQFSPSLTSSALGAEIKKILSTQRTIKTRSLLRVFEQCNVPVGSLCGTKYLLSENCRRAADAKLVSTREDLELILSATMRATMRATATKQL